MSISSDVALGVIRLQAQQRADLENNPFVSTPEWNSYISNSYKRLYNLLIAAYGNDWYMANTYQFTTSNSQSYPLPDGTSRFLDTTGSVAAKFWKLLGADLQYSASPSGWITLKRFEFIERNKFAAPNTQVNWNAHTNMRYRLQGNNFYISPIPQSGQLVQLWYAPAPTSLQFQLTGNTLTTSSVVSFVNTDGLSAGMNVQGTGLQNDTTIVSVTGTTTVIMSKTPNATLTNTVISMWNDSTTVDGVAGWDEFIIIDSAIKASIKEEDDTNPLILQRNDIQAEIEALAEGRDAGQAMHVSDALSAGGYGDNWGDFGGIW